MVLWVDTTNLQRVYGVQLIQYVQSFLSGILDSKEVLLKGFARYYYFFFFIIDFIFQRTKHFVNVNFKIVLFVNPKELHANLF